MGVELLLPGAGRAQRLDQFQRDLPQREKGQLRSRRSWPTLVFRLGQLDRIDGGDVWRWDVEPCGIIHAIDRT